MTQLIFNPLGFSRHPTAEVDPDATVGAETKVWNHSQVHAGAIVGERCTIGHNCTVFNRARLGDGITLESNIDVWPEVVLESDVFVGPSAVFTNDLTPRAFEKKDGVYVPTLVQRGASIGANAVIVCGVTIGSYAAVGAGSCVTRNVPPHALVAGSPARFVRWICMDNLWTRLEFIKGSATCPHCGRQYRLSDDRIVSAI